MYLEPWMIITLIVTFGSCAYLNYRIGHKEGLITGTTAGITATFDYLEKHGILKFSADGSIKGFNRKIKAIDISR